MLISVRPKNWVTFFAKELDGLFKEIMKGVKQKQQQKREAGGEAKLIVEEALIILNQPHEIRDVLSKLQYQLWSLLLQGCEEISDESEDEGIHDSQVKKQVEKPKEKEENEGIVMKTLSNKTLRSSDSSSEEDEPKKSSAEASSSSDEDEPKKSSAETSSSNEESDEEKKGSEKEDEDNDSDTHASVDDLLSPSPTQETPKKPTLSPSYKIPRKTLVSDEEDLPSTTLKSLKKGKCTSYCGQFIFHSFSFYRRIF